MIKNFDNIAIKDLDGNDLSLQGVPINLDVEGHKEPLLVKKVMISALLMTDPNSDGNEKLRRFKLAEKVNSTGDNDYTTEELSEIKEVVLLTQTPLICGQIERLIESNDPVVKENNDHAE